VAFQLLLIVLLGLVLRLAGWHWGQAYCYYAQGDGIEAYSVAVNYAHGQPQAQYLGQPNFNAHAKLPGPLWTLFCLAGLRLFGSVEGVILLVVLLNTGFIYLTYLLAKQTVGAAAALWAALFAATFPWVVYYSVGVYNPDVMPFLGVLIFLALWRVTQRDRSKTIFWVMVLLCGAVQFHMSGLMLIPAVVAVLLLCTVRLNYLWLATGALTGCALYLPYLFGDIAHDWQNTRGLFTGSGYSLEALKAVSAPVNFLVNWAPRWTRSFAEYRELGRECFGSTGLFFVLNFLSAVFAGFLIVGVGRLLRVGLTGGWRSPRTAFAKSPGIVFLAVIFAAPLVFGLVSGMPFHSRYCLVLLAPELALVAIAAVQWLDSPRWRRWFVSLLLITTVTNVWLLIGMYRFQGRQIEHGPVFIPSFRKLETVYQSLKTHAGPNRPVAVADAEFISPYVAVREREVSGHTAPIVYRLRRADEVQPDDPAVAFRENGIALVAPHR
jgi:4-amino-4-deoxy-L-arabinose transferase-like glycosyltransferase